MSEDVRILLKLTRAKNVEAQRLAVRALGRYESREFITDLLSLLVLDDVRDDAVDAIVRSFRGAVHPSDRGGQQAKSVLDVLNTRASRDDTFVTTAAAAIGQLPYERAEHADEAQAILRQMLRRAEVNPKFISIAGVARGIEWFARKNRKLSPLGDELVDRLRELAVSNSFQFIAVHEPAVAALVEAGAVDIETVRARALDGRNDEIRRRLTTVLAGASLEIDEPERVYFLKKLLRDESVSVRLEALRAWTNKATPTEGCDLLQEMLRDPSTHIMLAAVDGLGEACPEDTNLTDRLTAEAKTPPLDRSWHRAAHALVSLARRAPDRARIPLNAAYISHPTWEIRMYAARVAAMLKDMAALERLAMDPVDNVREAALPTLRALKGAESDPIFVAALKRNDYQLLRTAATALQGAESTPELSGALMSALARVTAEKKETSRDTRIALIERLGELGTPDQAEQLAPLLRDFDIPVALAALSLYERWQGLSTHLFAPSPLPRPPLPTHDELSEDLDAVFDLQSGTRFAVRLLTSTAPLTVTRFKRLVRANYYDGLTFHRVVPNFVIQGGSPGANEYAGDGPFMRDEIGGSNLAFAVGLSTRGRDTGDAQFYINLVPNRRLDEDYTVFGTVCEIVRPGTIEAPGPGREAVEAIAEGDVIRSIMLKKWDACRPGETRIVR